MAFLTTPIFTRIMTEGELGEYSLFTTYLTIMTTIGSLELGTGVLYSLLAEADGDEKSLTRSALLCVIASGLIASALGAILYYTQGLQNRSFWFLPMLLIATLCRVTLTLFSGISRYKYRYIATGFIILTEAILPPTVALIIFKSFDNVNLGFVRIASLCLSLALCAIPVAIRLLFVKDTERKDKGLGFYIKKILLRALPALPYFVFVSLIGSADRIIIARLLGSSAVARYSVSFSLGSVVTMLSAGVGAIMTPWTMRKWHAKKYEKASECISRLIRIIALLTLIFICFIPELFAILAEGSYRSAIGCVYPIALSCLPLFLAGLCAGCVLGSGDYGQLILISLLIASLSVSLNLALVRLGGIMASAVIYLLCCVLLLVFISSALKRKEGFTPINVNSYFHICTFSVASATLLYYLRDMIIPRIIVAIILLMVLIRTAIRTKELIKET